MPTPRGRRAARRTQCGQALHIDARAGRQHAFAGKETGLDGSFCGGDLGNPAKYSNAADNHSEAINDFPIKRPAKIPFPKPLHTGNQWHDLETRRLTFQRDQARAARPADAWNTQQKKGPRPLFLFRSTEGCTSDFREKKSNIPSEIQIKSQFHAHAVDGEAPGQQWGEACRG